MSDSSDSAASPPRQPNLGDRIRTIARQLRQEDQVQVKATARILGAAAQLAENHDRLVEDVVEMVEEDLDHTAASLPITYTAEQLQQQFSSFKDAKAYFDLTAKGWDALAEKLNGRQGPADHAAAHSTMPQAASPSPQEIFLRLDALEQELQTIRGDVARILQIVERIAQALS